MNIIRRLLGRKDEVPSRIPLPYPLRDVLKVDPSTVEWSTPEEPESEFFTTEYPFILIDGSIMSCGKKTMATLELSSFSRARKQWTDDEEGFLIWLDRRFSDQLTSKDMERLFGRSASAIRSKRWYMNYWYPPYEITRMLGNTTKKINKLGVKIDQLKW